MAKGPIKRRTQAERREEAETQLVDAAVKLIAKKGYDGFTLAEVGEVAGYSRGLATHYFGKKDELLALVVQKTVDSYNVSLADRPASERGMPRIIAKIRQYANDTSSTENRVLYMLIAEAIVRPILRRKITAMNAEGLKGLEQDLQAGIEDGDIRPDIDVRTQARLIHAFLRGQTSFAIIDPEFDPVRVCDLFIANLVASIGR